MNSVLRSTRKAASKVAVLRASRKSTLGFTDTREIPVSDLEGLLMTLPESREDIRKDIYQLCKEHDRGIPARYLGAETPGEEMPFVAVETPKGESKRKLAFTAIQKDQEYKKRLSELEAEWHRSIITQQLVEKTLENHRSTLQRRLSEAKKGYNINNPELPFEESPQAKHVMAHTAMPKLTAPVVGIHVNYHSSMEILRDDYDRLAAFCDRHPDQTLWYAPDVAVRAGRPQPLSPLVEKLLLKHVLSRKLDLKSLDKQGKEAQAWRWLIISHNHVNRVDRVRLHPKLSIAYERNRDKKLPSTPQPSASMDPGFLGAITSLMKSLEKKAEKPEPSVEGPPKGVIPEEAVLTFLGSLWETAKWFTSTYADADSSTYRLEAKPGKPEFKPNVKRWNDLFSDADQMMEGREIQVRDLDNELPNLETVKTYLNNWGPPATGSDWDEAELDRKWDEEHPPAVDNESEEYPQHPESFDKDGLTFFRCDIDVIDVAEGEVYVTTVHNGVEYHAVTADVPGKSAGKGKGKVQQGISLPPPIPGNKPKVPRPKTGTEDKPPKVPNLAKENPLRVKGEPKSKALSEEQRTTLRKFFKLEEGLIPADEWRNLSSKEKADALSRRSIPKWAVEAVLRDHANLQLILDGKITKESLSSKGAPRSAVTKQSSAALEAWLQLKSDFKGVPLLRRPTSGREKAFKKRFDSLVADYGEQSCFPKLKDRPDQQGRASSPRGARSQTGDMHGFVDMAKAFGEIARAFSGK